MSREDIRLDIIQILNDFRTDGRSAINVTADIMNVFEFHEKPLPEPMAFSVYADDEEFIYISKYKLACHDHINDAIDREIDEAATWRVVPLYTSAPEQKPLSDDEAENIFNECQSNYWLDLVRAIELKHGITDPEQSKPQSNAI